MATMHATVVSNTPAVADHGRVADLLTEYSFDGLMIRIVNEDTDRLDLHGANFVGLRICKRRPDGEPIADESAAEQFFEELGPCLKETLIVQVVGSEKCRFPATGEQFTVTPDRDVITDGFVPEVVFS